MGTAATEESILRLLAEHEEWRADCMNLIASENALSRRVRELMGSDLVQRYGNYQGRDLDDRWYRGNRYIAQIEKAVTAIVRDVYGATEVELRPIGGNVAGQAVIMALCKPGDIVMELCEECCGHGLAARAVRSRLIQLQVLPIPLDPMSYNVDPDATCRLIVERQPRMVILGSSCFLFPHPIREIAAVLSESPNTVLVYDASHVMGLMACGEFQDPLREGAHVMCGSTHKTLPGPQGGLIVGNDPKQMDAISHVVDGLVGNHHLMRIPALGIALLELKADRTYARRVIGNAQALGKRLAERGLSMVCAHQGFTRSHTLLMRVDELGTGGSVSSLLEAADIITSPAPLPPELGKEGVRLGTAEVTRHGATEGHMKEAANIIADVLLGRVDPPNARPAVHDWVRSVRQSGREPGRPNHVTRAERV